LSLSHLSSIRQPGDRRSALDLLGILSRMPTWVPILAALVLLALVALMDWAIGLDVSLGAFYVLPILFAAVVLSRWQLVILAAACAWVRQRLMASPPNPFEVVTTFLLAFVAYLAAGLFVMELNRNREQAEAHSRQIGREERLRREAQDHLKALAEGSPAAILTLDETGTILSSNRAALMLFGVAPGESIADVLPVLSDALKIPGGDLFRTAAQCQGKRRNGDPFLAHTWFSTYATPAGRRLAAIAVDSSEETREREEHNFRQLLDHNRIIAGAMYHEIRNLCSAIGLVLAGLSRVPSISELEDFRALASLVAGLENIASAELQAKAGARLHRVDLAETLNHLRIVIESGWRDAGATIEWQLPERIPAVLAESFGLTQAFLNITQNSLRAAQSGLATRLTIRAEVAAPSKIQIRFQDDGPGVADPALLFQPFQKGAAHAGLGLYISRAILHGFGGDLKYQPSAKGACFAVSLPTAGLTPE
jgi:two-component system, LuxR family, sensor kinase FixL